MLVQHDSPFDGQFVCIAKKLKCFCNNCVLPGICIVFDYNYLYFLKCAKVIK